MSQQKETTVSDTYVELISNNITIRVTNHTSKNWEHAIYRRHFVFVCGRKTDRIKGLVWEKDGFLLLYKRLEQGKFVWPRNEADVKTLTPQQFRWLMEGLMIEQKKSVKPVPPPEYVA